jgi:hypothetical protein
VAKIMRRRKKGALFLLEGRGIFLTNIILFGFSLFAVCAYVTQGMIAPNHPFFPYCFGEEGGSFPLKFLPLFFGFDSLENVLLFKPKQATL